MIDVIASVQVPPVSRHQMIYRVTQGHPAIHKLSSPRVNMIAIALYS
jgi:hypothetical protein